MGFIERLQAEKEAKERQASIERARMEERREAAVVVSPVQRGSLAEMRMERWDQARRFQKESGISSLMNTVAGLIYGVHDTPDLKYEKRFRDCVKDSESAVDRLTWDHKMAGKINIRKLVWIETSPDGIIIFHGGIFGSSSISRSKWIIDKTTITDALEKAHRHPILEIWRKTGKGWGVDWYRDMTGWGQCLSKNTLISTPKGLRKVQYLKIGDYIWTINRIGKKVSVKITNKAKVATVLNHKMLELLLLDGRKLLVSPGHPDIENNPLSNLIKGSIFDGSKVTYIRFIPYKEKYTYDILPAGETGSYWANNILLGSTLFNKCEDHTRSIKFEVMQYTI